ncbi:alpha/beta fold hydrolase [Streptosporangium lutulentum]
MDDGGHRDPRREVRGGGRGEKVLAAVGMRDVARDMDVLRAPLGDEKLTFLGVSYGTRLGGVCAEQFPENVRAMVFDGALDPRADATEQRLAIYVGFQRSSSRWLPSATAGLTGCGRRFSTPTSRSTAWTRSVARQRKRPSCVRGSRS